MKDRILIVDGTNHFVRTWAVNPQMDPNGEHIGGIVGFIKSLKAIMRESKPTLVIVVWDGQGGSKKRKGIYAEYKAGRKPRTNRHYDFGSPEESRQNLDMQHIKIRQLLEHLGVIQIELPSIEADDVIAFLCTAIYRTTNKIIVSTDRDFLQLVDSHTLVYSPTKKIYWTTSAIKEDLGILAENFIYMKVLMGDGSDNIKGIKGFGEKTVMKLFPFLGERKSSLEEIFRHSQENVAKNPRYQAVLDSRDLLLTSMSLMQLSEPVIGTHSVASIRSAVEMKPKFTPTEFKLTLIRDGIQMTDMDLFSVFSEYRIRNEALTR